MRFFDEPKFNQDRDRLFLVFVRGEKFLEVEIIGSGTKIQPMAKQKRFTSLNQFVHHMADGRFVES
jgi:hypothetical protein